MYDKKKVLIIKAGYSEFLEQESDSRKVSLGDILRVTPLLHLFKNDHVTWVTDEYAFPLLEGNKYITRLLKFDWISSEQLKKERFDIIINLEKVPGICAFADSIYAVNRFGFRYDPEKRKAEAYDKAAEILSVSSDPQLKRINKRTAQELLFSLIGEKWRGEEYILGYKPKTQEVFDVGLNTLIGQKWPTKAWPTEKWNELKNLLVKDGFKVTKQDEQGPEVLENIYGYMDWINSCKIIVTNDSLGLHLAIALKKKTIAIFGATPYIETPLYNLGKVIIPEPTPECLPCFKPICEKGENCLEKISVDKVYMELLPLLRQSI